MNRSHVVPPTLTVNAIRNAIDSACLRSNNKKSDGSTDGNSGRWTWNSCKADRQSGQITSLLHGFTGIKDAVIGVSDQKSILTVTFYIAYSTWDGRILYIDRLVTNPPDNERTVEITLTAFEMLACIAKQLHCRRLSWQHREEEAISFPGPVQPETMHGWLTLHFDKISMIKFTSENLISKECISSSVLQKHDLPKSFRDVIEICLKQYSFLPSSSSTIRRLRLANCEGDVEAIGRLVQGLADFEKEPDAVNVTTEQYCIDGGFQLSSSETPLFYCILLESLISLDHPNGNRQMENSDNATAAECWHACGMAFCWIGSNLSHGTAQFHEGRLVQKEQLFLYLEDLFIEEEHRGDGAGTNMMHALSSVALALQCHRMVWQALDWNTPALTFYQEKVGAKIMEGLLSTRFARSHLDEFQDQAN